VPARDEALLLSATLPSLLAQGYPGDFRVLVVDDRSSDGTAAVARSLGAEVVAGAPLPQGWVGKVWALEQGASAAGSPDYLLLTDADIRHAPDSLRRLVAEAEREGLALDSRMALLHCETRTERLLIPSFVFFFNLLYPPRLANRRPAAAGGCMLLRQGAASFASIRGEVIDDVNLARQVKRAGGRIRLENSRGEVVSLRPHPDLASIWRMVSRTAFAQLRRSYALTGLTVSALVVAALPPVSVLLAVAYLPTLRAYRLKPLWALTLPVAIVLYGAMTVDSALRPRPDW
jgi:hopene-associated glycosyltransferase HpnB